MKTRIVQIFLGLIPTALLIASLKARPEVFDVVLVSDLHVEASQ